MSVSIRSPGISLKLLKNVGRTTIDGNVPVSERFSGQQPSIDLKEFLGEQGSVSVSKSVRDPAGAFSLTLTDMIDLDAQDSLYGLIEPMDVIEIRIASDSYKAVGNIPIMMRGIVSTIEREESMQADGKANRRVIVKGQDYGKIWQILQIFSMPNAPEGYNAITSFPFFARFGLSFQPMPAGQFVSEVFTKIINKYIIEMGAQSGADSSPLLQVQDAVELVGGTISPFGLGGWNNGSIYSLLQTFGDVGAWNELYIEDREDAPYVVYRANPFISADGTTYIQPFKNEPTFIEVSRDDVIAIKVGRSDANVANYFWVDAPRSALNYDSTLRAFAYSSDSEKTFFVDNYGNNNPKLYGSRKMWESTQQGGSQETDSGNGSPAGSPRKQNDSYSIQWITEKRKTLIAQNKDNVVFEEGSIQLKGHDKVRAGTYLRLKHGNMVSDYYVVSVNHTFVPFGSYMTTAVVERGTGFIDRTQKGRGTASPYWSEIPVSNK